jgi:hypothetical protein
LEQTGPIGKLITIDIPENMLDIIKTGEVSLLIDDDTTGAGDGFAIDFVRILVNPKVVGSKTIKGVISDKDTGEAIEGASVYINRNISDTSNRDGSYTLTGAKAGINTVSVIKKSYKLGVSNVDIGDEEEVNLNIELEKRVEGENEAEVIAMTGDIDNFNFGFPDNYDPFSGDSTDPHHYPWDVNPDDAKGTDRIMVVSSYDYDKESEEDTDGYTDTTTRPENAVESIDLTFSLEKEISLEENEFNSKLDIEKKKEDLLNGIKDTIKDKIKKKVEPKACYLQIFVDDFQSPVWGTDFQVTFDGQRIPELENIINSLDQTGPIGKLITFKIPNMYMPLLKDGKLSIMFDDNITGAGDGFAIDFARLLINVDEFSHLGIIKGIVTDDKTGEVINNAIVSVGGVVETATDSNGEYTLTNVPAGLASVTVHKKGYIKNTMNVDVIEDSESNLDISLELRNKSHRPDVITVQYNNPEMSIDGILEEIDEGRGTKPIINNGRMLLPARALVEALGGKIEWVASEKAVIITLDDKIIKFVIDSDVAIVNGVNKKLDVGPSINNSRTFLPIRVIVENLDLNVDWNQEVQSATIY